jgi:hypothetical protein
LVWKPGGCPDLGRVAVRTLYPGRVASWTPPVRRQGSLHRLHRVATAESAQLTLAVSSIHRFCGDDPPTILNAPGKGRRPAGISVAPLRSQGKWLPCRTKSQRHLFDQGIFDRGYPAEALEATLPRSARVLGSKKIDQRKSIESIKPKPDQLGDMWYIHPSNDGPSSP